jgi:tRNA U34 5-carboxymethylaminomethyl modifying enzyme MnmG/GidA
MGICEQMAHKQHKAIPEDLDYQSIKTISMEAREKLTKVNIFVPNYLPIVYFLRISL